MGAVGQYAVDGKGNSDSGVIPPYAHMTGDPEFEVITATPRTGCQNLPIVHCRGG